MIFRTHKRGSQRWSRHKSYKFDPSRTTLHADGHIIFSDDEGNLLSIQLTTQDETRHLMSTIERIDNAFQT